MKRIILLVAAALCSACMSYADWGSIPFEPYVEIFEPKQRALIAWNGKEEILLLSTDLRASAPTKVLEVIPLPSEPEVKEGDTEALARAVAFINTRFQAARPKAGFGDEAGGSQQAPRLPAGEVTFHEKIGAHDVSVTHVKNSDGFIEWVEDYLKKHGVENPTIPARMKAVVKEYLKDGFTWFVFDVVELGQKLKTKDALQFRFKTESLYYPLRITRTESGKTAVELLIITPTLLSKFPGFPKTRITLPHTPVRLTRRELWAISKDMYELLGRRQGMLLRIWKISGTLSEFKKDLIAN